MKRAPPQKDPYKLKAEQYKQLAISWEASTEALLIVIAAFVVGLVGGGVHCVEYRRCSAAQTCTNASRWRMAELSCSFTNFVDVQTDVLYGGGNGSYVDLTRSVCAPGERLHVNSISEKTECAPYRSWPNALNQEIMSPGAATKHEEMCGAWIDAGNAIVTKTKYWSFYDTENANDAVQHAEAGMYASTRLSATDMGKFYSSCTQTVLGGPGAIRSSAEAAYAYFKAQLGGITTKQIVLEKAGWLASHACDSPALVGMTVDGAVFNAKIMRGSAFAAGDLTKSLFAVAEGVAMQADAESGNAAINANAMSSPYATLSELEYLYEGATGRTDHALVPLVYGITPELDGLIWLAGQNRFSEASAYLHGVAATCAFALHGNLDLTSTGEYLFQSDRPTAPSLGRLTPPPHGEMLVDVNNETVLNASAVTWSQIKAEPVGDPQRDCVNLARFLFPDRIDAEHFGLMITDTLYNRLEEMTNVLRASVKYVVQNNAAISSCFVDPAAVAAAVQTTRVRLAGAPRGTWAGILRDYPDGQLYSSDGPMVMAIKQAKAVFMDRTNILFSNDNVCAGPPVFPAMEANAYIYPGGDCTHVMLGVLRKPFADERYDNASLASRAGWVIAHELAHNSLVSSWYTGPLNSLLSRYTSNLYSEGIADIIGALAVIHAGYATATQVCQHVSQVWCARTPLGYTPSPTDSHPGANQRGDLLCSTLSDMGLM